MVTLQVVTIMCFIVCGSEAATSLKCRSSHQMVGKTGRLTCQVEPKDAEVYSIHWYKYIDNVWNETVTYVAAYDNNTFKGIFKTKQVAHSYEDGLVLLLLNDTTKDDEGMYKVRVESEEGTHTKQVYYVVDDTALGPENRVGSTTETMTAAGPENRAGSTTETMTEAGPENRVGSTTETMTAAGPEKRVGSGTITMTAAGPEKRVGSATETMTAAGLEKRVGSATETMTAAGQYTSEKTILIFALTLALCVIVFLIVYIRFRKRMTRSILCFIRNRDNTTPESEEQSSKLLMEDEKRMVDESSQTMQKQPPKRFLSLPPRLSWSMADGDVGCKELKWA